MSPTTKPRLTAEERQEQLVTAAVTAFSQGGYAGTTTDQVARIAGVSQPYVIRIFRTKQELFLAAVHRVTDLVEEAFRQAAAENPALEHLGGFYTERLLERPDLLVVLLHGFTASADPAIGEPVRACFGRLYTVVGELTGADDEQIRDFFARGMLITCLGAMRVIGPEAVPQKAWMTDLIGTL